MEQVRIINQSRIKSINTLKEKCTKSCAECLNCVHNKNKQLFSMQLVNDFNAWNDLSDILARERIRDENCRP
jgi:hypothetical protein